MCKFNNLIRTASLVVTIFLILSTSNICQADLIAFWHFEEPDGTLVADSINGHDGTATANVLPSTDYPALVPANTRSRSFPGGLSSGGIVVPDHSDLDLTGDFTLEAWIKPQLSAPGSNFFVAKHRNKSDDEGSWIFEVPPHYLTFKVLPPGSDVRIKSDFSVVLDTQWQHIALTYDEASDHYEFYVNAGSAGSGTAGFAGQIQDTSRALWIGGMEGNPETFNGWIDEVQIWNEYRTQTQIAEDMVAPVPAPGAVVLASIGVGLVGWLQRHRTL